MFVVAFVIRTFAAEMILLTRVITIDIAIMNAICCVCGQVWGLDGTDLANTSQNTVRTRSLPKYFSGVHYDRALLQDWSSTRLRCWNAV